LNTLPVMMIGGKYLICLIIISNLSKIDKIKIVQEGRAFSVDWMIASAKHIK